MNVVVNHLHLASPLPESALEAMTGTLEACRQIPGFVSAQLLRVDDEHQILVIVGRTAEAIQAVAGGPGGAWMTEHVRPLLSKDPERYVGEVLRGT